jgi:hypothetical protein
VTVHGTGMSLTRLTSRVRLSWTGCEATDWGSETSVRCRVGSRSTGHTTAGNDGRPGSGSVSQAWSVDVDVISQTRRANRAGTGAASVTVHGAGMGIVRHTAKGRTGHTGCEGTDWESETSVRCLVGHGARGTRRVVMTVGTGRQHKPGMVSRHRGTESASASQPSRDRRGVDDGTRISMGIVRHTARGRTGHTGCEGTEWESETSVRSLVGHGAAGTRRVVMTAGERGGSVSKGWSVDIGGLSAMRQTNRAGTSSASMTVHGSSMGLCCIHTRGREGHTGCEGTEWQSETSVRCLVGHGAEGHGGW